jgi:Flp pilus assembly pilin Flp
LKISKLSHHSTDQKLWKTVHNRAPHRRTIQARHRWDPTMKTFLRTLWTREEGQDIAEYAVMLAVILVIVVGTIRLIGSNANNVFSSAASSLQ